MNVLFVHFGDDWIAGSEVALLEMLRGLVRKGIKPSLWCNTQAMETAAQAIDIPVFRDEFAYYFDYASPKFSPRAYFALIAKAGRLIAQTQAELVHCNSAAPAQWMAPACWRKRVPLLVNLHSPYLRRSRYVLGLHLADHIVAVAAAVAAPLLTDGMAAERVSVVHNGFDETSVLRGDAAELRTALHIPREAVVGAIAGSLIRRKGHDILFEAIRNAPALSRPFHLLVIGDGPDRVSLEASAKGLPVHFLGQRSDMGAILRDCVDFLLAPSRQEAFGRVIIEAAFAGIPSIGANVDGIPEAILDNVTGLLVPAESPLALRAAIARLVEDDRLRRDLGAAAQRRAKEQFSIDICTDKMRAAYDATVQRYHAQRFALLNPQRLKPYWTLLGRGNNASS